MHIVIPITDISKTTGARMKILNPDKIKFHILLIVVFEVLPITFLSIFSIKAPQKPLFVNNPVSQFTSFS